MKVLILCTGNSCRSQMAQGFLQEFMPEDDIYSAGVETHGINPYAARAMNESGIDISDHTSNNVSEYADIAFDILITVCDHAKETCPVFFNTKESIHQSFTDPADATGTDDEKMIVYRKTRDEIEVFCREFAEKHS